MNNQPLLIIGNTGKTGARVEQRLQHLGYPTRGASRSSALPFDWDDPDTWPAVLEGTRAAYVVFYPDLAVPTAEQTLRDFISSAKQHGLQHIVLLSGRGEPGAQRAERVLIDSGLDWNVVRASWFMQNFSEGFMIQGIMDGALKLPAGDVAEPFVDIDDIADVAVAALTRPELRNRLFEVTGPRAMTFTQCMAELAEVLDYPVRFDRVSMDTFISELRREGLPEQMLWLMRELFTEVLDGRNSSTADGVLQALGRPATDFRAYLNKVLASGAWDRNRLLQRA